MINPFLILLRLALPWHAARQIQTSRHASPSNSGLASNETDSRPARTLRIVFLKVPPLLSCPTFHPSSSYFSLSCLPFPKVHIILSVRQALQLCANRHDRVRAKAAHLSAILPSFLSDSLVHWFLPFLCAWYKTALLLTVPPAAPVGTSIDINLPHCRGQQSIKASRPKFSACPSPSLSFSPSFPFYPSPRADAYHYRKATPGS